MLPVRVQHEDAVLDNSSYMTIDASDGQRKKKASEPQIGTMLTKLGERNNAAVTLE